MEMAIMFFQYDVFCDIIIISLLENIYILFTIWEVRKWRNIFWSEATGPGTLLRPRENISPVRTDHKW